MAAITLQSLTVRYGDNTAVDGIDLALADGEFAVFLGPSGCGKTTTLRCIAGLEQPTSGDVLFNGQPVNHLHASARNVAMVFQFVSLYPHKTVRNNIAFPLKARGMPAAEIAKKIRWVDEIFALGAMLDRYPGALPPGARQITALARAVVRDPHVLLLDEPLSAIDEQFREEMRWELKHLQKRLGVTTIHVTHDQREAMSLADRIVLMKDGEIVQVGTPQQLFTEPVNEFAAHFIGSPSINLVDAECRPGGLAFGPQTLALPAPLTADLPAGRLRVGIRPHDIQRGGREGDPGCARVVITDRYTIGRDEYFQFALGDQHFTGIDHADASDRACTGTLELVRFRCDRLRFFGPDGHRIGPP
jgi:ABC-type sugar transport system ATPase subunit